MEEILFITATVKRLDGEIARLNECRAALLRRLNGIGPTTRHLPPETLALIFQFSLSTKHPRSSPLLIGSVSSHWRQIAWSTPALWTNIDPLPIRRNAQLSDAHLLRLYFTNARALPVSLQIKLDRLSSSPSAASEEILKAAFIENSSRIGILNCSSKSSLRQRWAMLAPKLTHADFTNLERLEINLRGAPLARYDSSMFLHAPRLERVTFSGYHLPHEVFWEQITVLELSTLPVSQCLETLVKCPRLIEFKCTSPRQSHRPLDLPTLGHTTVSLDHLIKFEWAGALADWDIFLYSTVRLPNLRHLILGISHPLSRPLDPQPGVTEQRTTDPDLWKRFLRHTKSLSILECTVFHSANEWLDIFDIFNSTLHTLKFTAFRDADETVQLLNALKLSYDGRNYLPNLKSLSATLDLHPDRCKLILDILCSRRLRPILSSSSSSSSPTDPPSTSPDNASTISLSSTSTDSQPPTSLIDNPNDYYLNPHVDHDYWTTHTRLQDAILKSWPFGFVFGEKDKKMVKLLKHDTGLNLDVFSQNARVEWL